MCTKQAAGHVHVMLANKLTRLPTSVNFDIQTHSEFRNNQQSADGQGAGLTDDICGVWKNPVFYRGGVQRRAHVQCILNVQVVWVYMRYLHYASAQWKSFSQSLSLDPLRSYDLRYWTARCRCHSETNASSSSNRWLTSSTSAEWRLAAEVSREKGLQLCQQHKRNRQ